MEVRQIIYDLPVKIESSVILESTKEDLTGIINSEDPNYDSLKIDITQDLVSKMGVGNWKKLGVQAPPTTVMRINQKTILIGASGIYELNDDDIVITSFAFEEAVSNVIVDFIGGANG